METKEAHGWDTRSMVVIALMTAVTCVIAPISIIIPVSPVPISLGTLAVFLTAYLLGVSRGLVSIILYILLGAVGLPVFSNYGAGLAKIAGTTGGYLLAYLFMIPITGWFVTKFTHRAWHLLGMLASLAVCYLFGSAWLAHQAHMSFSAAMAAGVIPFIPGDIAKAAIVLLTGPEIRKRLRQAGLPLDNRTPL